MGAGFYFRRRPVAGVLLAAGTTLLIAAASGWVLAVDHQDGASRSSFRLATGEGTPAAVTYLLAILGAGLVGAASCLFIAVGRQELRERREALAERERRRVVVIEQRGLQTRLDSPLEQAVPPEFEGRRVPLVINHGPLSVTGVADRHALFEDAKQLRRDIARALADTPPGHVNIVYGGIAPVPMTFLAGVSLGDEGAVSVMDWDRTAGLWRLLDGVDDGERFLPAKLNEVAQGTNEVMLAVSVSYSVDMEGVLAAADGNPVVALRLPNPRIGNHWSAVKQHELINEFRGMLGEFGNRGIKRIHLFLAAPNSVVFQFGKNYDGRNMPELVVYQYERSSGWRFPWGIRMPCHGKPDPELVVNDHYPPAKGD